MIMTGFLHYMYYILWNINFLGIIITESNTHNIMLIKRVQWIYYNISSGAKK